jgi:hypothetical protein
MAVPQVGSKWEWHSPRALYKVPGLVVNEIVEADDIIRGADTDEGEVA